MRGFLVAAVLGTVVVPHVLANEQATTASAQPAKSLKLAKNETAIYVTNMHCKTCARKISSKLYGLKGVKHVRSNVKENLTIVLVEPKKPLDPVAAWSAVQAAGFKPTKLIGPAGTYVPDEDEEKKSPVKLAEKPSQEATEAR